MGAEMEIVQLTNRSTPEILGVTSCHHLDLNKRMMVARLEAYASLVVTDCTLYLDADMLVLKDFDLPGISAGEVGLTPRVEDLLMNWRYPIPFPEFKGKTIMEVMPFLYSFVYTSSELLFVRQLEALLKLPRRFQEWYGDQVTLKSELETRDRWVSRMFDAETYNKTIKAPHDFMQAVRTGGCIVHFKGPSAKLMMSAAVDWLRKQPV